MKAFPKNTALAAAAAVLGAAGATTPAHAQQHPAPFTLTATATITGSSRPVGEGFAVADLSRDGRPDLLVATGFGGGLEWVSNGAAGFAPASTLLRAGNDNEITSFAVADFDGNTYPDIVFPTGFGARNSVSFVWTSPPPSVFAARRRFNPPNPLPMGGVPSRVVTADFNGDGLPDLATANRMVQSVSITLSVGTDRSLYPNPPQQFPLRFEPRLITTGDFDGNNTRDLVVAGWANGAWDATVLYGSGQGGFSRHDGVALGAPGYAYQALAAGDLDGDGADEIVTASGDGRIYARRSWDLSPWFSYPFGGGQMMESALAVRDMNGDGRADVVAKGSGVQIGLNDGGGGMSWPLSIRVSGVDAVAPADFDANGTMDIAVLDRSALRVYILKNSGSSWMQARPDVYQTPTDVPLTVPVDRGLLANDSTPEGQWHWVAQLAPPRNGQVFWRGDGSFIYTPAPGFIGRDSFVYRVVGRDGSVSQPAVVTVEVLPNITWPPVLQP